jgi:hypothetical protein
MGHSHRQYRYRSWVLNPLIRRGWQHDGRNAHNPLNPPVMPQKVPHG